MGFFRPATAISVLLLAAFVLLLLSVLSAPIVESITIAEYKGVKFGVFGYCTDAKGCGSVGIGYNMGTWRAGTLRPGRTVLLEPCQFS